MGSLAVKIEQIKNNLMGFAKELAQKEESVDGECCLAFPDAIPAFPDAIPAFPDGFPSFPVAHTPESLTPPSLHEELEETAPTQEKEEQLFAALKEVISSTIVTCSVLRGYRESKDIFLAITKELTDIALNDADCSLKDLDPVERCIVEDLKEFVNPVLLQDDGFIEIFYLMAFLINIMQNPEPNLRRRVLDAIQSVLNIYKNWFGKSSVLTLSPDHSAVESIDMTKILEGLSHNFQCLLADFSAKPGTTQPREADVDETSLD